MTDRKQVSSLTPESSIVNFPFQLTPSYSFSKAIKRENNSCFYLPQIGMMSIGGNQVQSEYTTKRSQLRFDRYSSRKEPTNQAYIPGPNVYSPQQPKNAGTIKMYRKTNRNILKTQLQNFEAISLSPGPGSYNLESKRSQVHQQKTIREEKSKSSCLTENPGVGAYELYKKQQSEGWAFSKSNLKFRKYIVPTPGPSTYQLGIGKTQGMVMSRSERKWEYQEKSDTLLSPGPGAYNYDTQYKLRQTKKSLQDKLKKLKVVQQSIKSLSPKQAQSFNNYSQNNTRKYSLINFTQSKRNFEFLDVLGQNSKFQRSPGPAQYSPPGCLRQLGMSFSNSKRSNIAKRNVAPGVGSYSQIAIMGKNYERPRKKKTILKSYDLTEINRYVGSEHNL